jgi:beta-lysine 5,6-aminomutase alpha subunit
MRQKLGLDPAVVAACRQAAATIARQVTESIAGRTTTSVERTVARFLGIDGVDDRDVPLPNVVVAHVHERGGLGKGVAHWLGNAMVHTRHSAAEIGRLVAARQLDLCALPVTDREKAHRAVTDECRRSFAAIHETRAGRAGARRGLLAEPGPLLYVLTATGNVHEDVVHALSVAENGGAVVSMTRSTAQSLLDFVPHGATTEGYGGTYATQENFRIVRAALDRWSAANGRYVMLSSFCSGLCMPEIAAIGAMEGLDNLVNDALYGILYRNVNVRRTLVDQRFSRMINGHFGIVINTGEDNYLRTADAVAAAPSVVASQFINYFLALESGVPSELIAVGNAFEIDPAFTNGLLYEWAQAQLTRELFPDCPTKYMPPTKHMDGNPLRTHACDSLFNLVTVATRQSVQTIGAPTEGVYTPHIHDRVFGLENCRYVANFARDLADEIEFAEDGMIRRRAAEVLAAAARLLSRIVDIGLLGAIEAGTFGNVSRAPHDGRGADGIVEVDDDYINPCVDLMETAHVAG